MASTPPKINKKDAAMTAASIAVPELGAAMAVKGAMASKSTSTSNNSSGGTNFRTNVSKDDGNVNVNVYGSGGSGGSGSDSKKEKKYIDVDSVASQQSMIFWVLIIIHLIDGLLWGFTRDGKRLITICLFYSIAAIVIAWKYDGDNNEKRALYTGMVVAIILPLIFTIPYVDRATQALTAVLALKGLLLIIPVAPVMAGLSFKENEKIRKRMAFYVMIWMIIGLLMILATFGSTSTQQGKALVKPWESIKFVFKSITKSLSEVGKGIITSFKKSIAQATGQPYEGEEESRVGIYIEDVRPIESKYSTTSEAYIEAKIKAINVKEPVNVNTICYIEGVKQGDVSPTMLYDVSGNYDNIVSCNLGILPEGTYTVKVRANFEFESTSDIKYTFVNSKLKAEQYGNLLISPINLPTYTGGPVALGLPPLSQPLRIDTENPELSTYTFGVSLQNKWSQGKVVRGLKYLLNVPPEVTLIDCSRDPITKNEPDTQLQRNIYTFAMNTTNAQDVFDGVRCRMQFNDPNALLGTNLKTVKTFSARARYEYAVEGSTTIIVEKT